MVIIDLVSSVNVGGEDLVEILTEFEIEHLGMSGHGLGLPIEVSGCHYAGGLVASSDD